VLLPNDIILKEQRMTRISSNVRTLSPIISLLCAICVSTGLAQTSAKPKLEVFQLKQVSAQSAAQILNELLSGSTGFRCVPDGGNRLVVLGTDAQFEMIRTTLKNLEAGPEQEQVQFRVFSLKYLAALDASKVLRSLGLQLSIATDDRTNSLILSGPANQLSVVEALLMRLDQSSADRAGDPTEGKRYRMDLVWLMEGPSDASFALREPIQFAGDAIREIQDQGFLEVLQANQASVAVRTSGRFEVQSTALLGRMEVNGVLKPAPNGKLELELHIRISHNDTLLTSLSTEITTEPNHDVVLGIAGAVLGGQERRSAFVVRVTQ
jgi:hypothetical protein